MQICPCSAILATRVSTILWPSTWAQEGHTSINLKHFNFLALTWSSSMNLTTAALSAGAVMCLQQ